MLFAAGKPMPYIEGVQIALQLAQAVQQLHALQILHLDIKPQNVLLDKHDAAVLSDVGLRHVLNKMVMPLLQPSETSAQYM